jgi:PEP-CTERM motif
MRLRCHAIGIPALAVALMFVLIQPVWGGQVLLDFSDIPIPGGTDSAPIFAPYVSQGFTLTATNAPTGFSSGLEAHGPNSIFWEGKVGVSTFAPASPPDNVLELTQTSGQPFSLLSIDLARLFPFDLAPTVTFTGTQVGGGTVTESVTVDTPSGVRQFETFDLAGFTNLVSVTWGQPAPPAGANQFTDILLQTGAVPEPSSLALMALGFPMMLAYKFRAGRRARGRHDETIRIKG